MNMYFKKIECHEMQLKYSFMGVFIFIFIFYQGRLAIDKDQQSFSF